MLRLFERLQRGKLNSTNKLIMREMKAKFPQDPLSGCQ